MNLRLVSTIIVIIGFITLCTGYAAEDIIKEIHLSPAIVKTEEPWIPSAPLRPLPPLKSKAWVVSPAQEKIAAPTNKAGGYVVETPPAVEPANILPAKPGFGYEGRPPPPDSPGESLSDSDSDNEAKSLSSDTPSESLSGSDDEAKKPSSHDSLSEPFSGIRTIPGEENQYFVKGQKVPLDVFNQWAGEQNYLRSQKVFEKEGPIPPEVFSRPLTQFAKENSVKSMAEVEKNRIASQIDEFRKEHEDRLKKMKEEITAKKRSYPHLISLLNNYNYAFNDWSNALFARQVDQLSKTIENKYPLLPNFKDRKQRPTPNQIYEDAVGRYIREYTQKLPLIYQYKISSDSTKDLTEATKEMEQARLEIQNSTVVKSNPPT
jgi:hypothetical protein